MGISASILVGAVGAILRFTLTAQAAGFKMHAVGVILMIAGGVGVATSLIFRRTWGVLNRNTAPGSRDTALINGVTRPRYVTVDYTARSRQRRRDPLMRHRGRV